MRKILLCGLITPLVFISGSVLAATDPAAVTDNLSVNVEEICSFSRSSGSGSIAKTMTANKGATGMGGSTFTAICNSNGGYSVKAVFTSLTSASSSASFDYANPTKGYNRYSAYLGNSSSTTRVAANGNIMDTSEADGEDGTTQQIYYKCSTANDIPAGTYTGTATYTLTQK